ncbi:hypothetical protein RB593_009699 [Gaeumannomyces tritici]
MLPKPASAPNLHSTRRAQRHHRQHPRQATKQAPTPAPTVASIPAPPARLDPPARRPRLPVADLPWLLPPIVRLLVAGDSPAAPCHIHASHRSLLRPRPRWRPEPSGTDTMSEPLTAAEEENYTSIIDAILATANLETVSIKSIRGGLQKALGDKDLSGQKNAIKQLIGKRFDAITSASGTMPTPPPLSFPTDDVRPSPKRDRSEMTNGHDHDEAEEEDGGEIEVSLPPAKKKQKRESSTDDDAKLAAQLQAEENRRASARATRGSNGNTSASKPRKKAPKKKSSNKVKAEDDSDVDGSGGEAKTKRKAGGGFQKPFSLSHHLALLCGEPVLSRPQVVKKLWEHIKGNDLQDPNDKRQILCDEMMQAVFKQSKVDMFQMNKLIGNHLYPVEEE